MHLSLYLFRANDPATGYNLTRGGDGIAGYKRTFSSETLQKMSAAKKGRKLSPEHRALIGEGGKRAHQADPALAQRKARHGHTMTDANKVALRGANSKPKAMSTKQKIAASVKTYHAENPHPMLGKQHTLEAKQKMSSSHRQLSDETRRKIRDAAVARASTAEARERLRQCGIRGAQARWGDK